MKSQFVYIGTLCLTIFFLAGCTRSTFTEAREDKNQSQYGGILQIEPRAHRLGLVPGGINKEIELETYLKNIGSDSIQITDILASCDCTKTSISKNILVPGETAVLKSLIKIGDSQEPKSTRIFIKSSDTELPTRTITFEWTAEHPIFTEKKSFEFFELPLNMNHFFDIPVLSNGFKLCHNCKIEVPLEPDLYFFEWRENPQQIQTSHAYSNSGKDIFELGKLHFTLLTKNGDNQYHRTIQIKVRCDDKIREMISIPVRWSFDNHLIYTPTRLFFGKLKPSEKSKKDLFFKSSKNQKFQILSVKALNDNLEVFFDAPHIDDFETLISVTIQAPNKPGSWIGNLIVETNHPQLKRIEIPSSFIVEE